MEPFSLTVQRKKVTNTADGGSDITFSTDQSESTQSAKIFLIPNDRNIKLTVEILPEE